jgi:hypothetical protein
MDPKGSKLAQNRTVLMELSQAASEHDPKRDQHAPQSTQDGPNIGQCLWNWPKKPRKGPKHNPEPNMVPKCPRWPQDRAALMELTQACPPRRPRMVPKRPKMDQYKAIPMKLPQDASKRDPKRGQDGTQGTQDGPKIKQFLWNCPKKPQ